MGYKMQEEFDTGYEVTMKTLKRNKSKKVDDPLERIAKATENIAESLRSISGRSTDEDLCSFKEAGFDV